MPLDALTSMQALVVNEFETDNWGDNGTAFLEARGYFTGQHWIWIGIVCWGERGGEHACCCLWALQWPCSGWAPRRAPGSASSCP